MRTILTWLGRLVVAIIILIAIVVAFIYVRSEQMVNRQTLPVRRAIPEPGMQVASRARGRRSGRQKPRSGANERSRCEGECAPRARTCCLPDRRWPRARFTGASIGRRSEILGGEPERADAS